MHTVPMLDAQVFSCCVYLAQLALRPATNGVLHCSCVLHGFRVLGWRCAVVCAVTGGLRAMALLMVRLGV
jgi:hypothetical protein